MRIAHLSDLHLRHHLPGTASLPDRLSRAMPQRFAQALQQIRALAPDLLVITGDLLDYPFDALDDPIAQELARRDLYLIADLIADVPVPVREGDSLARFQTALADPASPPQVHVQHYVVWPERNEEYPHTYGAGAAMREAILAAGNVRLVLSGHYHTGVPLFGDQSTYFATVPGFAVLPHPFALYELAAGGRVTAQAYRLA